nr:hypothetical protein [Candidatus Sigynarchaeota archaeon]
MRKGQKQFMDVVSASLDQGKHVVVSAPNGFGKTVSTLCAAIPVAIRNDLKLVYLCRTHTQNSRVIAELNAIHAKMLKNGEYQGDALSIIGGVSLRGRNEMCFKPQIKENSLNPGDASAVCSQLRSDGKCAYFNNLQKLVDKGLDLTTLSGKGNGNKVIGFDAENINEYAMNAKVCPYFYSRELLKNVRVSVGNYQWFFNPVIHDKFLDSIDAAIEDVLLVIDEAHNIPSVAEDLHSLKLTKYSIGVARKELGDYFHADPEAKELVLFLKAMEDVFSELEKTIGNQDELEFDPRELLERMQFYFSGNFEALVKKLVTKGEEIQKFKLEAGRENPRS